MAGADDSRSSVSSGQRGQADHGGKHAHPPPESGDSFSRQNVAAVELDQEKSPGQVGPLRPRRGSAGSFIHPKAGDLMEVDAEDMELEAAAEAGSGYLRWVGDLCRNHLGQSVLEFGAGIGSITELYAQGRRVLATDMSPYCVDVLHRRFDGWDGVSVARADLRTLEATERFESVLLVNVLEHIRDDVDALRGLRGHLQPGGRVVIYVPALNGLYGAWDTKAGHLRRYAAWRLKAVIEEAGLEPLDVHYVNMLAMPAWFLFSHSNVERTARGSLSVWDRTGVPLTRFLESRFRAPIGLNLLGVGRLAG